ncbi:MAG: maleylpyruvate isomerase N-terminal domain-containing protein [Acidimicrobiales bacterium]|jgi:uncharacterized protein (TIGR03083 family)
MADAHVEVLRSSVARLRDLVSTMSDADLTRPAYPSEWSIADVFSHIGSGAVIMNRRLDDVLAGLDTPDDFAPGVWDTWNAKTPTAQRDDALTADAALLAGIDSVTADEREAFSLDMGPMSLGFDAFVGMRLNEHAFHAWDIEVAVDPAATIPEQVAALVVDNLELIARYTAKPTGDTTTITVATTEPPRGFTIALTPESVTFSPTTVEAAADIELTAEALARLVYGRLDPQHTPHNDEGLVLDVLRRVFPGP